MKVNMTPNPLDVVTIHASQGDTEARQWEFELHNNGDVIDASEISDQLVFKAYKGGTEQLLPENTSTPTTSPFKGDIRYPQGLLTDQEFTYRQSPTEKDGNANIKSLYGKTLVWNQLVQQNGTTETSFDITYTNNGDGSWTVNGTASGGNPNKVVSSSFSLINGHKYLVAGGVNGGANNTYRMDMRPISGGVTKEFYNEKEIWTSNVTANDIQITIRIQSGVTVNNLKYRPQVFDLTMLGIDNLTNNEVLEWFADYFPLSYYSYNQGSLLSFNGNGIKTTGKNLFNSADVITGKYVNDGDGGFRDQSNSVATNYIEILPNTEYKIISAQTNGKWGAWYDANKTFISGFSYYVPVKTSPSNAKYMAFTINYSGNNQDYANNVMLLFNGEDETFEPYTSSTLSLPTSTYFPTGMKSAGSVYDELTESKATTRVGSVDLGSLTWVYYSARSNFYAIIPDMAVPSPNSLANAKYPLGNSVTWYEMLENNNDNNTFAITEVSGEKRFYIKNTAYTDATAFKTAMNGVYLYYELANPTETSFTTASLVTENAEIPLSNEDGTLIGKCTEELSAEPGFHDAKIKLSDSDGTCYSNKLQLHVERSPQ